MTEKEEESKRQSRKAAFEATAKLIINGLLMTLTLKSKK